MLNLRLLAVSLMLAAGISAAQTPAAITSDPAVDKANPPAMQSFQIPSYGVGLNALMYIAAGAGPHPVVVLLHGFPGNEKNLDLAQAIRRAGWDVLYFDYRGSWGTPGDFSFTHSMEDTQAAIAFLRDKGNASRLRADPQHIVLVGHSMGGMIAAYVGAHDPAIEAVALISAADMAGRLHGVSSLSEDGRTLILARVATGLKSEGMAPLAGCTPESLALDLMQHADEWSLAAQAPKLASRPVLVVTSDDGLASVNDALVSAMQAAGDKAVTAVHIATDHSYSGNRIELEQTVLAKLAHLQGH
jgi:pimeloyl-ACP methyl ester carboxylesterase